LNQNTDADKSSVVVVEKVMEGLVALRLSEGGCLVAEKNFTRKK
jgi:hypothetical protein